MDCPACGKQTRTASENPVCLYCNHALPSYLASAILSPDDDRIDDETMTASLAAPLPEEVLRKTGNPANLFGKYVLLREIGRGAAGSVVLAWDTYLSRTVALKFLHATASRTIELNDEQRVQEFLREARLAARLQHPNIVRIHEVDCREGRLYISMDYVSGGTLADLIHGPAESRVRTRFYLEPARFLALLRKIALAVHHAHTQDPPVVHRDLKPQNVLIDERDNPTVADFGLAGEIRGVPHEGSGGIRGTPAYMAPEQAQGRSDEIDARTDVYSLGVILYEMLTGETPFHGENIPSVLRKIAFEAPEAPSAVVARRLKRSREVASCPEELRAALERICLKALSKVRADRHPSALEFAGALDAALPADKPAVEAPAPKRTRLRMLLAGAAALILLAALLPARLRSGPPAAAQPPRAGEDLALQADGFRAAGQWPAFRGAVADLRRRAPEHPRLRDFETLVAGRDAAVARARKDWTAALNEVLSTPRPPDFAALRRKIGEFPETEEEFRAGYRRTLERLTSALLDEARGITSTPPSPAWTTPALKERAASLRVRIAALIPVADDTVDRRALAEALPALDRVLAYRGTWTLRINVTPFAELRLLRGDRELTRDFTPALLRNLEIEPGEVLELSWPSQRDPRKRWTTALPPLRHGTVFVVTGDLRNPELQVERE